MLAQASCTRAVRERRQNLHALPRVLGQGRLFQRGRITITVSQLLRLRCKFCNLSFRGLAVIAGVTHTSEADTCVPLPP